MPLTRQLPTPRPLSRRQPTPRQPAKLAQIDPEDVIADPSALDPYIADGELEDYKGRLEAIKSEAQRHASLADAQAALDAAVADAKDALDEANDRLGKAEQRLAEAKDAYADALIAYQVAHPEKTVTIPADVIHGATAKPAAHFRGSKVPQTGDPTSPLVPLGVAAAGVAAVAASRRRRHTDESLPRA